MTFLKASSLEFIKDRIDNGESFQQWCIDNKRQDILERWNYDLNKKQPDKILYTTFKKIWLNCPKNIHKPEFKTLRHRILKDANAKIICSECESLIKTKSEVKNAKPKRSKGCYNLGDFLESFNLSGFWSIKNKESIYSYTATQENVFGWWNCKMDIHSSYFDSVENIVLNNGRCPICRKSISEGEGRIEKILNEYKIHTIPQKRFSELIGVGEGLLSYDFYLPDYNLIIEYQGGQHERSIDFFGGEEQFVKQQEHDKRKREYAEQNNIKLLEIWYYDFDNIETILEKELSFLMQLSKY